MPLKAGAEAPVGQDGMTTMLVHSNERSGGSADKEYGARPVACVLLGAAEFPRTATLIAAVRRRLPGFANACAEHEAEGPAVIGRVDGKRCIVAFCDEPGGLDPEASCIESAWWWRDARESLEQSRAYILVCMLDADEPAGCWGILSKLTAAVVETVPAIGVLWEPADAVWPADEFRAEVDRAGDELPIRMLVSVKLSRDECAGPDGAPTFYGHTWGLTAFDLMEIELACFEGDPIEMVGILLDMASYLIKRGPIIKHGDTFGQDGDHKKFKVRHEPSCLVPGRLVHRLYLVSARVS